MCILGTPESQNAVDSQPAWTVCIRISSANHVFCCFLPLKPNWTERNSVVVLLR